LKNYDNITIRQILDGIIESRQDRVSAIFSASFPPPLWKISKNMIKELESSQLKNVFFSLSLNFLFDDGRLGFLGDVCVVEKFGEQVEIGEIHDVDEC